MLQQEMSIDKKDDLLANAQWVDKAFDKSRFLQMASASLLALAVKIAMPHAASANHNNGSPTPWGCYGAPLCPSCSGNYCTYHNCRPLWGAGCRGGGHCWASRVSNGTVYICCDYEWRPWNSWGYHPCICRSGGPY